MLELERLLQGTKLNGIVDRIGVADDFYFVGKLKDLAEHWQDFEQKAQEAGFIVRRSKCAFLVPYLDARDMGYEMGFSPE